MAEKNTLITIILAIIISAAALTFLYVNLPQEKPRDDSSDTIPNEPGEEPDEEPEESEIVFSISFEDQKLEYTLEELESFEQYSGSGSYIRTKLLPDTVEITGPYEFIGVKISTLILKIENLPENYNILVFSSDDWRTEYTKDQVEGLVKVYNESGNETEASEATIILAYKENNEYITDEKIGPLRIAFVGDNPITASDLWAKMVVSIEITEI